MAAKSLLDPSKFICEIEDVVDPFVPTPFRNPRVVEFLHDDVPRFGKPNEFLDVIWGSHKETNDYLVGLFASSLALFALMLVWWMALLYFKYKGPERYGWWSGRHKTLPPMPTPETDYEGLEYKSWIRQYEKVKQQNYYLGITIVVACAAIIISSLLMVFYGANAIDTAKAEMISNVEPFQDILEGSIEIVANLADMLGFLREKLARFLVALNGICPLRGDICSDVSDASTCNDKGILKAIFGWLRDSQAIETMYNHLNGNSTILEEMIAFKEDLANVVSLADEVRQAVEEWDMAFFVSGLFALILSLLCFYMIVVSVLRLQGKVATVRLHKAIMGLFVVLVVLCFVSVVAFVASSLAISDVCVDGPDARFLAVVDAVLRQGLLSRLMYETISFYMSQCTEPQTQFNLHLEEVAKGMKVVSQFTTVRAGFQTWEEETCGTTNSTLAAVVGTATDLFSQHCNALKILRDVRNLISCGSLYPIWQSIVHEAFCTDSTIAFEWLAASQFVTVLMAVVVLSCRAAMVDIEIGEAPTETDKKEESNPVEETIDEEPWGKIVETCSC